MCICPKLIESLVSLFLCLSNLKYAQTKRSKKEENVLIQTQNRSVEIHGFIFGITQHPVTYHSLINNIKKSN